MKNVKSIEYKLNKIPTKTKKKEYRNIFFIHIIQILFDMVNLTNFKKSKLFCWIFKTSVWQTKQNQDYILCAEILKKKNKFTIRTVYIYSSIKCLFETLISKTPIKKLLMWKNKSIDSLQSRSQSSKIGIYSPIINHTNRQIYIYHVN